MPLVTLVSAFKTNNQLFYQQNEFIQKQRGITIWDNQATAKITRKLSKRRKEMLLIEKKKVGGADLNKSPLEEKDRCEGGDGFSLVELWHFPLAGLVVRQEEKLPAEVVEMPFCLRCKLPLFLFGVIDNQWQGIGAPSTGLPNSKFSCGFLY